VNSIVLKKRGETANLSKNSPIAAQLTWSTAVDLDLHAFFKTKEGVCGHIFYDNRGNLYHPPCIQLDEDAGADQHTGSKEENITIKTLAHIESIIIATNIYKGLLGFFSLGDSFAKYDGKVTVRTEMGPTIEVPLDSEEVGKWCVIAKIDNTDPTTPQLININKVQKTIPEVHDF